MSDLDRHLRSLAKVQLTDFRARNLFQMVADRVPPNHRVLDVGCGAGGLVSFLLSRGFDANGVDTSEVAVQAAREFLQTMAQEPSRISLALTTELLERGVHADTVVSMDCLEHVEDDHNFFAELVALVRPGGTLIVTVPAMMSLYGERDRRVGHYRRYELDQLVHLAGLHNLEVQELRHWNFLGVVSTYLSQKILKRNVDESFRYGEAGIKKRMLRGALNLWFRHIENRFVPPVGLSLLMVAHKGEDGNSKSAI